MRKVNIYQTKLILASVHYCLSWMAAVPNETTRLTEGDNEVRLVETKLEDGRFDERCSSLGKITSSKNPGRVYTVDDAIEEIGFGPFQILISIFSGLLWVADAMELMLLSILSPLVKCQWNLTNLEEAMITSVVFLGQFCGGIFWGWLFDIIGRKKALLIVDIGILIFGVLSALRVSSEDGRLPGFPWMLICRFGLGFFAGGTTQVITYYAEFLPLKRRGSYIVLISVWWTIGTIFGAVLAIGVLGYGGLDWHWYLGLAATPLAIVMVLFPFVPESARFYLVKGQYNKAEKVIKMVAKMNFKEIPSGRLVSQEEKEKCLVTDTDGVVSISDHVSPSDIRLADNHSGGFDGTGQLGNCDYEKELQYCKSTEDLQPQDMDISDNATSQLLVPRGVLDNHTYISDNVMPSNLKLVCRHLSPLFINGMWMTTVILIFLSFGSSLLYFGVVLLTTSLLRFDPHCDIDNMTILTNASVSFCVDQQLDTGDYITILWSAAAEFPGIIVTFIIIEIIGRKMTMAIEFFGCMIGFLLLFICASNAVRTVFLFIIRAFSFGVLQAVFVYIPEVYPTKSRALGLGICNTATRFGGMATPIVAQVIFEANDYVTLSLYAGSCVFFAVLAMFLPIETKGRALRDSGG